MSRAFPAAVAGLAVLNALVALAFSAALSTGSGFPWIGGIIAAVVGALLIGVLAGGFQQLWLSPLNGRIARLEDEREQLSSRLDQSLRERAELTTIFDHMADGLLVLGSDERVVLCNPAAARLLGRKVTVGRPLPEVVRDPDLVEIARAAGDGPPVMQLVELRPSAGAARRWLQVVATRLPPGKRRLMLLQNVTELRYAEAARRDFVANVSHELRTPVASLTALVETLEGGAKDDPKARTEFLRRMHIEVDGLAHLVSELLQLARVEAGRIELELDVREVDELLREAVEHIQPYAERVGLSVSLDPRHAPGAWINADDRRLGQVLANLLDNAVKFTPPGGVIQVGARTMGDVVEIWVSDTGVGVEPDQLLRIFERFYKIDVSRAGRGTGLGLAICKHLVQAHGGRIWAESPGQGCGSTFRFTVPTATDFSDVAARPPALARRTVAQSS